MAKSTAQVCLSRVREWGQPASGKGDMQCCEVREFINLVVDFFGDGGGLVAAAAMHNAMVGQLDMIPVDARLVLQ